MSEDKLAKKAKWSDDEVTVLVEAVTTNEKLGKKFGPDVKAVDRTKFWYEASRKINAVGGKERSSKQVEKKWRDLKSQTKSKEVKRRAEMKKTGGGVSAAPSLSCLEEKILGTLPSCSLEGIPGGTDSSLNVENNPPTDMEEVLQTRSAEERLFHSEIEKNISASKEANVAKDTSCELPSTSQKSKSPCSTRKHTQKRSINNTEEFIFDIEEKKLSELHDISLTLKSIDNSLRQFVSLKKSKLENDIESSILEQFEL